MPHEIETMAFVRQTPWHGLGNKLTEDQPIRVWMKEAGFEFNVLESPVHFFPQGGPGQFLSTHKVLYRSDSDVPLSVVSDRYKVVQPREVLEFYRDLVEAGGFKLETAGVLKGGRKVWALAKTGVEDFLPGNDRLKAYLLLATGYDGTLATTAQFTSVRVVCNNTLQMAVGDTSGAIRVPHSVKFDAKAVKDELGIGLSAWGTFMAQMRVLAARKIREVTARRFLVNVLGDPELAVDEQPRAKLLQRVFDLYSGQAVGSKLASANDTAFGLVNAVTEYVDHHARSKAPDSRLHSAWFGNGAVIKQKAFTEALKLAA